MTKDEILKQFREKFKPGSLYDGEVTASTEEFESFLTAIIAQVEKETAKDIQEIATECIYEEWVEVATPANFEAGKVNFTAFDRRVEKYLKKK